MRDHMLGYFERFAPLGAVKRVLPPLPIDGLYAMYKAPAVPDVQPAKPIEGNRTFTRVKPAAPAKPSVWLNGLPPCDGEYETRAVVYQGGPDKVYKRKFIKGRWRYVHDEREIYGGELQYRMPVAPAAPAAQPVADKGGWRFDLPPQAGRYVAVSLDATGKPRSGKEIERYFDGYNWRNTITGNPVLAHIKFKWREIA